MNWNDEGNQTLIENKSENKNEKSPNPQNIPNLKKSNWWAEDNSKVKEKFNSNLIEQERFQSQKMQESDDDIPIIPDIDDIQYEGSDYKDVKIPSVNVKESTFKELNNKFPLDNQITFGNINNIDLTILTSHVYNEKDSQEDKETWTMESLFIDISK